MNRPDFPGMDPWLEGPAHWPDVHNSFIAAIRADLSGRIGDRYFVGVEERAYIWSPGQLRKLGVPDLAVSGPMGGAAREITDGGRATAPGAGVVVVEVAIPEPVRVKETHLRIVDVSDRSLVTVIEVLSPSNKLHRRGREDYLRKRRNLLRSPASLVEIDLLRAGPALPLYREAGSSDYRILVSKASRRPRATIFEFGVRSPVPAIGVPLAGDDEDMPLDLNSILHQLFDMARYHLVTDYARPPSPPLHPGDGEWASLLVSRAREAG